MTKATILQDKPIRLYAAVRTDQGTVMAACEVTWDLLNDAEAGKAFAIDTLLRAAQNLADEGRIDLDATWRDEEA